MGIATVTWVQKFQFVGTDSTKHSVVVSTPDDENGVGMKPSELLLISLASCTAYDVVNILQKKRKLLSSVRVDVEGQQQETAPWPFTHIHLHYVVVGSDITARDVDKAIHLSHEKYCSVSATLRASVEITHDYDVREAGEQTG
ncbi:MAG: OsmC family protein [Anaerolineae bacterium]|nr:OsmC family protein [Anaerolineae bacterium]